MSDAVHVEKPRGRCSVRGAMDAPASATIAARTVETETNRTAVSYETNRATVSRCASAAPHAHRQLTSVLRTPSRPIGTATLDP